MPLRRRWAFFLSLVTMTAIWYAFQPAVKPGQLLVGGREAARAKPTHRVGGRLKTSHNHRDNFRSAASMPFRPGIVKPVGQHYTKMLVIPRTKDEDVSWIGENFGGNKYVQSSVYFVDDSSAELHVPRNKGHEAMAYFSYIIENYDNLSDVNIFMHAHRFAWHNNELLYYDAVQIVSRLSSERVQREGFVNLRCHWEPGCPSWMHPGVVEEDISKQEETMLARSWSELFPFDPIPNVLAQPCCAQFAISRDRIRSIPLATYVFYRDWLLRTPLSDYISGRVWEYIWQFVFTGKNVVCPKEHICYCDGFGVCFGGEDEYNAFYDKQQEKLRLEEELRAWRENYYRLSEMSEDSTTEELEKELQVEAEKGAELDGRISSLQSWCEERKASAKERGDVAMHRAQEAGRPWRDGDGF